MLKIKKKLFLKPTAVKFVVFLVFVVLTLSIFFIYGNYAKSRELTPERMGQKINQACQHNKNKETCYTKEFKLLTEETDMDFSKQTLASLQTLDPKGASGCHLIAHAISIAETRKDPGNWLGLLREQDVYKCSGGFLHGVLEAHMGEDSNFTLNAEEFLKICTQVKDQQRGRLSCNHNLGHLLLVQEGQDFQKATKVCNSIEDFNERYECLSGMFMENITRLNLEAHGLAKTIPWDQKNTEGMENLCRKFTDLPGQACWKVISYMYASIHKNNPVEVFKACNSTPTKKTAEECYIYGAGNMVAFVNFNPDHLKDICTVYAYDDPLYKRCMFQVMGGMLGSTLAFSDRVIQHCLNSPEPFRRDCFIRMGSIVRQISSASNISYETICSKVPAGYRSFC